MGALRDRMVREMQLRRFAPSTQEAYLRAVWGLAAFYRRSPDELSSEEVKSYLLHSSRMMLRVRAGKGHKDRYTVLSPRLLEAGVDVRTLQLLMGHRSIRTTIQYVHLTAKKLAETPSPLDLLEPGLLASPQ